MGYNLGIGEGKVHVCWEERIASIVVERHASEDAPFNSSDDYGNYVYPSYSVWDEFCRAVGLYLVFFAGQTRSCVPLGWWKDDEGREREGLLLRHPGAAELTEAHYRAFKRASDDYAGDEEYNRRRLDWLVYWTRWALDHCEHPTFYNS